MFRASPRRLEDPGLASPGSRILILKSGGVGDHIMLLPALKALGLRLRGKSVEIRLAVQKDMFPIFQGCSTIDRLYPLPLPFPAFREADCYLSDFEGAAQADGSADLHLTDAYLRWLKLDPQPPSGKTPSPSPAMAGSGPVMELFSRLRENHPRNLLILLNWVASTHIKSLPPSLFRALVGTRENMTFLVAPSQFPAGEDPEGNQRPGTGGPEHHRAHEGAEGVFYRGFPLRCRAMPGHLDLPCRSGLRETRAGHPGADPWDADQVLSPLPSTQVRVQGKHLRPALRANQGGLPGGPGPGNPLQPLPGLHFTRRPAGGLPRSGPRPDRLPCPLRSMAMPKHMPPGKRGSDKKKRGKARPTLSLCMIVRNEEILLPGCLRSIRDHVDEIIIVDTGSTDRTLQIAREFGARVFEHPWKENFAEHRNQSIAYATGDWILVMDADEEMLHPGGELLARAIQDDRADSIALLVVNPVNNGRDFATFNSVRLFRADAGIRYEGHCPQQGGGVRKDRLLSHPDPPSRLQSGPLENGGEVRQDLRAAQEANRRES